MTDPLPEWFEKAFAERMQNAIDRLTMVKTTEDLWEAKGRIWAFTDIRNEIDLVKSQIAEAEREASERYLTPHA